MFPRNFARVVLILVVAIVVVSGCSAIPVPTKDASAGQMMPNLSAYTIFNTADFQGTLANVTAGGAALTGNVQVSAMIKIADRALGCYRNAGAFESSVYVNKADPTAAGAILIVNMTVAQDVSVALSCINPKTGPNIAQPAFQPCTNAYAMNANGKAYQVYYLGSKPNVCVDFCSALQGCTAK